MRLHRIALTDVRGFGPRVEVVLAGSGVSIIEAPNETGKSTLLDAVDVALTYKDSSKHRDVKSLWPADRDVPSTVEVELSVGDHRMVVTKTFRRSTGTTLRVLEPRPATWTGDEAHDQLRALLDAHVDAALLAALRFTQGRTLEPVALGSSPTLAAALDQAASGSGGAEDTALWDLVRAEYGRWFTGTGRERDTLTAPRATRDAAAARVEELEHQAAVLAQDAEALAALEARLPHLVEERAALEPQLADAAATLQRIETSDARLAAATAALEAARAAEEQALERRRHREDLVARRAALAAELEERDAQDPDLHEQAAAHEADYAAATRDVEAAEAALEAAQAARSRAQLLLERTELAASHARTSERLTRVRAIDDELVPRRQERAEVAIDAEHLSLVERAAEALRLTEAQLAVGAPNVRVVPARALTVELDGTVHELAPETAFDAPVADRFVVDLAEVARIEFAPGASAAGLRDAVADARRGYADACRTAGVADVAAARRRHERQRALDAVIEQREQQRGALLEGESLEALEREEAHAAERLRALDARLAAQDPQERKPAHHPDGGDHPDPAARPDVPARRAARDAADAAEREAAATLTEQRARLAALASARNEARTAAEVARMAAADRRERLGDLDRDLVAARAEASDAALAQAATDAAGARAQAASACDDARAAHEALAPDVARFEHQRLTDALAALETHEREHRERAASLRASLQVRGQDGLGEHLQEAQDGLARAEADVARVEARAAAAAALYDEFAAARDEAYRAYRAPLRDLVGGLARRLYGREVHLELGEELAISERTLDGVTLPWEALSAGAREQLAVLTGLAAAQLAGDGGVPFVLDDAFGYTDQGRLARLGALLGQVDDAQVIVLTCVAERFHHVPGARTIPLGDLRRGAADQPRLDASAAD